MDKRKIIDIVDCNYVHASVLYYFGIEFYNYCEHTLGQVCYERGLDVQTVIKRLESTTTTEEPVPVSDLPIDLIIEYLKHSHYLFIKQKLPYIGKLVEGLQNNGPDSHVIKDLKFVFPLFVEDFIHHIYKEEDTLFSYIMCLYNFKNGKGSVSKVYFEMERHGLQSYAIEHEEHDDEMLGIRNITAGYKTTPDTPLHIKVLYAELKTLERDLQIHAQVENETLFPKALMLEKEIRSQIGGSINLN